MTKKSQQALSARTVRVREDVSALIRRVATRMHERNEAALKKQREAEREYAYDNAEVIVCMVRRVPNRSGSIVQTPLFIASTVTEIGTVGIVSTQPDEDRFLESSMRMALAKAYYASKHGNYDACRERAGKAKLLIERSYVLGSGANGGVR